MWILVEELASKQQKRPIYFEKQTAIGPMGTADLDKAQRFDSKQAAMMTPAYMHALSFYEPQELKEHPDDN